MLENHGIVVELGRWEVLVRKVPPTASYRFQRKLQLPKKPARPMATYPTITGDDETVPALPESDEYNTWLQKMEVWEEECDAARNENALLGSEFAYDYAIIAWRPINNTDVWLTEQPADWEMPGAYVRHGVDIHEDNLRLEFILNELLISQEYLEAVQVVMYPASADDSPIKREEVDAAVDTFQYGNEVSGTAGRMDSGAGKGRGKQYTDERSGLRNAGGRSQGSKPGWLVRMLKRSKNIDDGS